MYRYSSNDRPHGTTRSSVNIYPRVGGLDNAAGASDAAIGSPTNGAWPTNCTHQRMLIAGGRWTSNGITASDIAIQTSGPYTEAAVTTPYLLLSRIRSRAEFTARSRNTTDHPNATPKCMRRPIAAVCVPPVSASGPSSTLATP